MESEATLLTQQRHCPASYVAARSELPVMNADDLRKGLAKVSSK
jgi:hypothetical protein